MGKEGFREKYKPDTDGMYSSFYGTSTKNPMAFCLKHKLYLTKKQVDGRKCLDRKCCALRRVEEHQYWEHFDAKIAQKELMKDEKKANKKAKKEEMRTWGIEGAAYREKSSLGV